MSKHALTGDQLAQVLRYHRAGAGIASGRCAGCEDCGQISWPCETYRLAREVSAWREEHGTHV